MPFPHLHGRSNGMHFESQYFLIADLLIRKTSWASERKMRKEQTLYDWIKRMERKRENNISCANKITLRFARGNCTKWLIAFVASSNGIIWKPLGYYFSGYAVLLLVQQHSLPDRLGGSLHEGRETQGLEPIFILTVFLTFGSLLANFERPFFRLIEADVCK